MIAFSIFSDKSRAMTPADGGVKPKSSKMGTIFVERFFSLRKAELTARTIPSRSSVVSGVRFRFVGRVGMRNRYRPNAAEVGCSPFLRQAFCTLRIVEGD